jgi:glycosyltransferase involved in cell wall biosynthesis
LIPAWNTSQYIGEAIQSVLAQTHKNWDILIVDDGSTDRTIEAAEAWMVNRDISIVRHKRNLGVGAATKTGLDNARGPIVAILDSDDKMYPDALEAVLPHFEANPRLGFLWTQFHMSSGRQGWSCRPPRRKSLLHSLTHGWWRACAQQFLRIEDYRRTRGIDPKIRYASDLQVAILMAESGCAWKFVPKTTYWYRCGFDTRRIGVSHRAEQTKCAKMIASIARRRRAHGQATADSNHSA